MGRLKAPVEGKARTRKPETVLREFVKHAAGTMCDTCRTLLAELRRSLRDTRGKR